jgi:hypothetical protein
MSRKTFVAIAAAASLALTSLSLGTAGSAGSTAPAADRVAVLDTKMALRDLWVEHIFWIRSYVLAAAAADEARRKVAEQEVLANARALAGSVAPFYGQGAADALLKLLGGHWGAVRDLHAATRANSARDQERAVARLTGNARDIAKFLSGANPYLPEEAVFGLLSGHGGHHITQIRQIDARDYAGEAATWHAMRKHMLTISDAIVDALAKQFPQKFGDDRHE